MGHYKANLRDIEFNLFEALELGPIWIRGRSVSSTAPPRVRSWPKLPASPKAPSPSRSSPPTASRRCFCRTSTP